MYAPPASSPPRPSSSSASTPARASPCPMSRKRYTSPAAYWKKTSDAPRDTPSSRRSKTVVWSVSACSCARRRFPSARSASAAGMQRRPISNASFGSVSTPPCENTENSHTSHGSATPSFHLPATTPRPMSRQKRSVTRHQKRHTSCGVPLQNQGASRSRHPESVQPPPSFVIGNRNGTGTQNAQRKSAQGTQADAPTAGLLRNQRKGRQVAPLPQYPCGVKTHRPLSPSASATAGVKASAIENMPQSFGWQPSTVPSRSPTYIFSLET